MGAAANKQFRGSNPSTTGNDPKAVAIKLIVDALTKFQKNYPNERLGIDHPRSYDPTLFKRTVMEAAAEFRCEHALAELTEKDVEELGLQYCESIISQPIVPMTTTRPPSLGRPASLGGGGNGSGNGNGGNSSNSVHHTELLVEDVMDQDVDETTGNESNTQKLITTIVAPPSSSSSSTRRRPLFDETDSRTTILIPVSPLAAGRMTPDRPNSSHEISYGGNNLRTSSSQRNLSSVRPLSSGGSHESRGQSSHGNNNNNNGINLSSPLGSHVANRSVQPFEAFPADISIPSINLPLSPYRRSPSKSSRPATNIGTIDESDNALGFHPSSSSSSSTGYKPRINLHVDSPPLITSHPGSRQRERERELLLREQQETSSSSAVITMTDLSGGFSPSEIWRRSANTKDKEKHSFENHAFSPPTSSQQSGIRQLSALSRVTPDNKKSIVVSNHDDHDDISDSDNSDHENDGEHRRHGYGGGRRGLTRHGQVLPSFEATTLPPEKRTTNTPTKQPTKADKILSAKNSLRNILVHSLEDDHDDFIHEYDAVSASKGDFDDDHRTTTHYSHHHSGNENGGYSVGPLSVLGERNEAMMGLQRQKALSTKQNEQLQREVEALQKQLAQLEELEGEMEQSSRQTGLAVAAMGHVEAMSTFRKKAKGQGHKRSQPIGLGTGDQEGVGDKDLIGGERERKGGRDRDHNGGMGRQRLPNHVAGGPGHHHHHTQQDSPRGTTTTTSHGNKGTGSSGNRNKGGGGGNGVPSRSRRAVASDHDDLFDEQQQQQQQQPSSLPLGVVMTTRDRLERDKEREHMLRVERDHHATSYHREKQQPPPQPSLLEREPSSLEKDRDRDRERHTKQQRAEPPSITSIATVTAVATKESILKEDFPPPHHHRKETKEKRLAAAAAAGGHKEKVKEKDHGGGYVPSLTVLATGDPDSSLVKNYPARSPRGLRRSHGAMAGGVGNNRNNGAAGGLHVMVVDGKHNHNNSHGDKGISDSKEIGVAPSENAGAKSPRYYQFNPRVDREQKEQQPPSASRNGPGGGILGHPQPPSGSQPLGPRSQHHRPPPQQQPQPTSSLLRNNNNHVLTSMPTGGGAQSSSQQSSSHGPSGMFVDKEKDQNSDYEMEDSTDFGIAGGGILGGPGRIGKSSNMKVDAKKLYERRVGREKLSKQRSNAFPLLGPGQPGGGEAMDSDTESKDPGDQRHTTTSTTTNHSDYEDNHHHHHEDNKTTNGSYDFHDQHHHPRLDRMPSNRSKAIVASGLNRRVAAVVDQTLTDDHSEASASELSDAGGDEEKHGHKPRRRSVMAGKVISRRRFPNINGNNNNPSTADEKETDMDGGGSGSGSLPLQQPLRVPRQLPAKSTPAPSVPTTVISRPPSLWNDDLDSRWAEVDFLLRRPLQTEEDILYTIAATEAGLMFIEQLNSLAKSLGVLRGTLSRWLLPYDHNTRIDEQSSTPHSVLDNMPEICRGNVTERQVHYLVAGANGVRRLVRIKIADDNDLEQARVALVTTMTFFKRLQAEAAKASITPFELFMQRE